MLFNENPIHVPKEASTAARAYTKRTRDTEYSYVDVVLMFNVPFLFVISELDEGKILY